MINYAEEYTGKTGVNLEQGQPKASEEKHSFKNSIKFEMTDHFEKESYKTGVRVIWVEN